MVEDDHLVGGESGAKSLETRSDKPMTCGAGHGLGWPRSARARDKESYVGAAFASKGRVPKRGGGKLFERQPKMQGDPEGQYRVSAKEFQRNNSWIPDN